MTVDFANLRTRLQRSLEELETGRNEADAEHILRERTRKVASLRLDAEERSSVAQVIVVKRTESMFAFPVAQVLEVRQVQIAKLPHRTRYVCGLFQLRGQIHCLVDARPFVGPTEELAHQDFSLAILLECDHGVLGMRIDDLLGPRTIYADELDTGRRERKLDFVSQVTRDCVEIVDVNVLAASAELQMTGASGNSPQLHEGKT